MGRPKSLQHPQKTSGPQDQPGERGMLCILVGTLLYPSKQGLVLDPDQKAMQFGVSWVRTAWCKGVPAPSAQCHCDCDGPHIEVGETGG